jgi:hypothetical protein
VNPLYVGPKWIAQALGRGSSWFYANRDKLYEQGFPRPDPVIGLTSRESVEKWVANRSNIAANLQGRGISARSKGDKHAIR